MKPRGFLRFADLLFFKETKPIFLPTTFVSNENSMALHYDVMFMNLLPRQSLLHDYEIIRYAANTSCVSMYGYGLFCLNIIIEEMIIYTFSVYQ